MSKWIVRRDDHGYSAGWTMLDLRPGTTRNEENAQRVADLLNRPTYDPATEVVVSREDAEWAVSECVARQKDRKNRVNRAKAYGSHLEPANRRRIAAIKRAKGTLARLRRALAREEADRE